MYNEQTNAHLTAVYCTVTLFIVPTSFKAKLAGSKQELPVDDMLALKHVGAINKQYNKLSLSAYLSSHILLTVHTPSSPVLHNPGGFPGITT
jgi:hypothetical protein